MAKSAGRKQLLKKGATVIGGVRVKSISFDNTPIDVTDDDSAGFQEMLSEMAGRVCNIEVSGVTVDYVLRDIAADSAVSPLITDLSFTFAAGTSGKTIITGDFVMSNYKEDADYKDAVMFSASFTSSGAWELD